MACELLNTVCRNGIVEVGYAACAHVRHANRYLYRVVGERDAIAEVLYCDGILLIVTVDEQLYGKASVFQSAEVAPVGEVLRRLHIQRAYDVVRMCRREQGESLFCGAYVCLCERKSNANAFTCDGVGSRQKHLCGLAILQVGCGDVDAANVGLRSIVGEVEAEP